MGRKGSECGVDYLFRICSLSVVSLICPNKPYKIYDTYVDDVITQTATRQNRQFVICSVPAKDTT